MSRILRALGLSLGAIAALVAVMAPAAQAETGALTAGVYSAIITGEQEPGLSFDLGVGAARTVECVTSDLNSTISEATDPVTFKPVYANCISQPGGFPTTIKTNGCHYTVGVSKPGTTGIEVPTTGRMQITLNCPPGQQIQIHVYETAAKHAANNPTCTYDLGPQGPIPGGIYHNLMADVLATVAANFVALNTMGPAFICGGGPFEIIPARLTGNYTLRGYEDLPAGEGALVPIDIG
jgi:hypothetical protein